MSLRLYKDAACTSEVSNGTFANAIKTRHDGSIVDAETAQLWLKNDDNPVNRTYVSVSVTAELDTADFDLEFAPDEAGVAGAWGETATLADGTYLTAVPFWVRAIVQPQAEPVNYSSAKVKVLSEVESTEVPGVAVEGYVYYNLGGSTVVSQSATAPDAYLTPLSSASVVIDGATAGTSDANGWFSISGIAPGEHTLTVITPTGTPIPGTITVSATGESHPELTLTAPPE